jgi:hypothetical protein
MDIIWIFLAMALLYGLPELLRKRPRKANEYPQFPDKPISSGEPLPNARHSRSADRLENQLNQTQSISEPSFDSSDQSQYVQMTAAAPTVGLDEQPLFSSKQVITGIVWAEILAKPKTVKPFASLQKH